MVVYLRKLELRYMEEQKEIEEMNKTQQPLWLVNSIIFSYEGETHMENESKRKQNFLQLKGKHINYKKSYIDRSKSKGRKEALQQYLQTSKKEIHYQLK